MATRFSMGNFVRRIATWWNGQTLNTRIHTWRNGVLVGRDAQGNIYYQSRRDERRRWVIYNGEVEASRVGPDWHGWLHHTFADPPTIAPIGRKEWQREHRENRTGTADAWRPHGSIQRAVTVPPSSHYEAWEPEQGGSISPSPVNGHG